MEDRREFKTTKINGVRVLESRQRLIFQRVLKCGPQGRRNI